MNNERYNQIIDEMWINYMNHNNDENGYECKLAGREICIKLQFIDKCNTDSEFSEKWGVKIEERELSLEERSIIACSNHNEVSQNIKMFTGIDEDHTLHKNLDDNNIPTKLITITYNNETIESYE